jgi:hypothetical protein
MSHGVKIVIGFLMLIVIAVAGLSYGFLRLATP